MKDIDKKIAEVLNELGSTKESLVRELYTLEKWFKKDRHSDSIKEMPYNLSLEFLFYYKRQANLKTEDIITHAEELGYELNWDEAEDIVIELLNKYDCNVDENTQIDSLIERRMRQERK